MKIYGISQSLGTERQLKIEKGIDGIVLTILDADGGKEQGRISVPGDDLVTAITDGPAEGATVKGLTSGQGQASEMAVQVRRNEVWLSLSAAGQTSDIAIGFDDLQDALEGVINRV